MSTEFQFEFPPVLDERGNPISAEESERQNQSPARFVPFTAPTNGGPRTFSLAINPNNVDDAVMGEYDVFKAQRWAVFNSRRAKVLNGREEESDGPSGEQIIQSAKMRPLERAIFLKLLFPPDWEKNPVVLGSNCSDVPADNAARRDWFARGGTVAMAAMEAVVMFVDPTGPLVQEKEAQAKARIEAKKQEELAEQQFQKMQELLIEKMSELQETPIREVVANNPNPAPSSSETSPPDEPLPPLTSPSTESDKAPWQTPTLTLISDAPLDAHGDTASPENLGSHSSATP